MKKRCIPGCDSRIVNVVEGDNAVDPQEADIIVGCLDPLRMNVTVTVPDDVEPPIDIDILPEVMLSMDVTESFTDVLPQIQQLIIAASEIVYDEFPNLRFGVSTYMDKLHQPFGAPTDTTFELYAPLTNDPDTWEAAVNAIVTGSGGDIPEAQLIAMEHIAFNAEDFGFTPNNQVPENQVASRIQIIVTDAPYHEDPNCILFQANPVCVQPNVPGPTIDPEQDYPTVQQVQEALLDNNMEPLFLVTPPVVEIYEDLVDELGFGGVFPVTEESDPAQVAAAIISFIQQVPPEEQVLEGPVNVTLRLGAPSDMVFIQPRRFTNVLPGTSVTFNVTFFTKRCNPFVHPFTFPGLLPNDEDDLFDNGNFFDNGLSDLGTALAPIQRIKTYAFINGHQLGVTRWNVALCPCMPKKKKKCCCGGGMMMMGMKKGCGGCGGCGGGCGHKKGWKKKMMLFWMMQQMQNQNNGQQFPGTFPPMNNPWMQQWLEQIEQMQDDE
ncbi:hypothetical protein P9112_004851 [Eukaryota sp. TZLM1-RC]